MRLRSERGGYTLIEVITAMVLLAIIMVAASTFTRYAMGTTVFTLRSSSVQNEMRHIMRSMRVELAAATSGRIENGMGHADLVGMGSRTDNTGVLFSFNGGGECFSIVKTPPGSPVQLVRVADFIELPHLKVNFEPKTANILIVTLTYDDPDDPKQYFELRDEIFMPNIPTKVQRRVSGVDVWVDNDSLFPAPPGGGDSVYFRARNPPPSPPP